MGLVRVPEVGRLEVGRLKRGLEVGRLKRGLEVGRLEWEKERGSGAQQ